MDKNELPNAVSNWPSPLSEDAESCGNHPKATDSLTGATKFWSSPTGAAGGSTSRGGDRIDEPLLGGQAKQWPTPMSKDHKSGAVSEATSEKNSRPLNEAVLSSLPVQPPTGEESQNGSGRRLNPAFVCTLMGVPWWWTRAEPISFAAREMRSYHFALLSLLSSLCGEQ